MIQIPLEIGDTVLGGRFKNKKITVREIGVDEYGNPTINGRSILKIRIPKLYAKENIMENVTIKKVDSRYWIYSGDKCLSETGYETKELAEYSAMMKGLLVGEPKLPPTVMQRSNDFKLKESVLRKIVLEILREVDVSGTDIEKTAENWADTANQIKVLEAELKRLGTKFEGLDNELRTALEAVGKTRDTFIKGQRVLIKIEREGGPRTSRSYKTGFEYLYEKVNGTMKQLADEALKMTETVTYIKSKISVVPLENTVNENKFTDLMTKFGNWLKGKFNKLFALSSKADKEIDALEKYISK